MRVYMSVYVSLRIYTYGIPLTLKTVHRKCNNICSTALVDDTDNRKQHGHTESTANIGVVRNYIFDAI